MRAEVVPRKAGYQHERKHNDADKFRPFPKPRSKGAVDARCVHSVSAREGITGRNFDGHHARVAYIGTVDAGGILDKKVRKFARIVVRKREPAEFFVHRKVQEYAYRGQEQNVQIAEFFKYRDQKLGL